MLSKSAQSMKEGNSGSGNLTGLDGPCRNCSQTLIEKEESNVQIEELKKVIN